MFDIGFAELLIIGVVSLLVIGPERLPGAVRTASAWINRFRRSFNDIKQEVQRELHNDAVIRELKELRDSGEELRRDAEAIGRDFSDGLNQTVSSAEATLADTDTAPEPSLAPTSAAEPPAKTEGDGQEAAPDKTAQSSTPGTASSSTTSSD